MTLSEDDRRGLVMGLALHEKGRDSLTARRLQVWVGCRTSRPDQTLLTLVDRHSLTMQAHAVGDDSNAHALGDWVTQLVSYTISCMPVKRAAAHAIGSQETHKQQVVHAVCGGITGP